MTDTATYYTSMDRLLDRYDRVARQSAFRAESSEQFEAWKTGLRQTLRRITGMDEMEPCDPEPQLLESVRMDGYRRDKLILQTEPGVWMPLYKLVPDSLPLGAATPCVLALHGHQTGGKLSVAGREDIPAIRRQIGVYRNAYGIDLVRQGYVVFCPDARAFGERREWTKQGETDELLLSSSCTQLNHMAIVLGQSVTGMWVWDLMRLVDYIESSGHSGPIGCVGLSGGGLQSLWLAAMDERIRCAVVSGYFYGVKDALLRLSDNCACNYVPNLWKHVDMGDLGALVAPRPLLIESGTEDELNGARGIVNVTEQVEIARGAYALLDAGDRLQHFVFAGGHYWHGGETGAFLAAHLQGGHKGGARS